MSRARKKSAASHEQDVVYARLQDAENMRWIYSIMAETNQPMREVVERAIEFAKGSKRFVVPVRETVAERAVASQKEREERLRAKAAGGE